MVRHDDQSLPSKLWDQVKRIKALDEIVQQEPAHHIANYFKFIKDGDWATLFWYFRLSNYFLKTAFLKSVTEAPVTPKLPIDPNY